MSNLGSRSAALAASVWLAACATDADRPASWSYLHTAIIEPSCATAGCHSRATALAGVDLSTRASAYRVLTGRDCDAAAAGPGDFVVPYAPERSRLLYLLRGAETQIMPPDVPLPAVEVDLVERWIAEGAPCD